MKNSLQNASVRFMEMAQGEVFLCCKREKSCMLLTLALINLINLFLWLHYHLSYAFHLQDMSYH